MGGAPTLLMLAIIGVTYGWQPDGTGGVEYIIQIPADQLTEIQQTGSVSSLIDPAVRGHVSKVTVRVGEGTLPRQTPAGLASGGVARADFSAIDPPALATGNGPLALPPANGFETAMKPQSGDVLSMPPPPTTSAQPPGTMPSTSTTPGSTSSVVRPPEPTRSPYGTPPLAGTRTNGPSTAPVTQRDSTWNDLNGGQTIPPAQPSATAAGIPSSPGYRPALPPPMDTTGSSSTSVSGVGTNASAGSVGGNGAADPRGSTPFGQLPAGVTLPSTAGSPGTAAASPSVTYPGYSATPGTNPPYGSAPSYGSTQPYAAGGTAPPSGPTYQPYGNNQPYGTTPASGSNPARSGQPAPGANPPQTSPYAGFDPADRDNPFNRRQPNTGTVSGSGPYSNANPTNSSTTYPGYNAYGQSNAGHSSSASASDRPMMAGPPSLTRDPRSLPPAVGAPPLSYPNRGRTVDDDNRATATGRVAVTQPPSSASGTVEAHSRELARSPTQPLFFNVILLLSLVSNVYLVFWMKNLRHRFRDLVTAKRLATSDAA